MTQRERQIRLNKVYNLVDCARLASKTINDESSDAIHSTLLTALNELNAVQEDLSNCQEERKKD
jgi:hypothetical protein